MQETVRIYVEWVNTFEQVLKFDVFLRMCLKICTHGSCATTFGLSNNVQADLIWNIDAFSTKEKD